MTASLKLILLNGAVAVGKSTLTRKYTDSHPLALGIEGDQIISMLGGWIEKEDTARELVFELTKSMLIPHLRAGYDVVLPYLVTDNTHVEAFETIASECRAQFIEIALVTEKDDAVRRLFERGAWGEIDAPALSEADVPVAEDLYDRMMNELEKRPRAIRIHSVKGEADATYRRFIEAIES